MINNLLKIFFVVIIAGLYSCSEDPASIGSSQIPNDIIVGEINSLEDSVQQSSTFFEKEIDRGTSSRIFIGRYNDLESHALIRFILSLSDSVTSALEADSLNVLEANVKMFPVYELGSGAFDFSVHKINSSWTENDFDTDSLANLQFESSDLASAKTFSDSLITFSLPLDLVSGWMNKKVDDSIEDNNGLYFQPSAGINKVLGFRAFAGNPADLKLTALEIVVEKPGAFLDTVYSFGFPDVYVPKAELPAANGILFVQGGVAVHSTINFDLSRIPKSAIINNAELRFFLDNDRSYLGEPTSDSLFVRFNLQDSTESSGVIFRRAENYFAGPVTGFVEEWISGKENYGLDVTIFNELNTVSRFALFGSGINDPELMPRLEIYYTTLK